MPRTEAAAAARRGGCRAVLLGRLAVGAATTMRRGREGESSLPVSHRPLFGLSAPSRLSTPQRRLGSARLGSGRVGSRRPARPPRWPRARTGRAASLSRGRAARPRDRVGGGRGGRVPRHGPWAGHGQSPALRRAAGQRRAAGVRGRCRGRCRERRRPRGRRRLLRRRRGLRCGEGAPWAAGRECEGPAAARLLPALGRRSPVRAVPGGGGTRRGGRAGGVACRRREEPRVRRGAASGRGSGRGWRGPSSAPAGPPVRVSPLRARPPAGPFPGADPGPTSALPRTSCGLPEAPPQPLPATCRAAAPLPPPAPRPGG